MHIRISEPYGAGRRREWTGKHQAENIAGYYSSLQEFLKGDTYSREHQTVYTAADHAHWLVVEWKDKGTLQACVIAENGVVTAWDRGNNGDIRLTEAVRRAETCGELLVTTRKRYTLENERSIRFQLAKGKKQVAEGDGNNRTVRKQISDKTF